MPLRQLSLQNFTRFSSAAFELSPNLNIITGENATGKTTMLGAMYATIASMESHKNHLNAFEQVFDCSEVDLIRNQQSLASVMISDDRNDVQMSISSKSDVANIRRSTPHVCKGALKPLHTVYLSPKGVFSTSELGSNYAYDLRSFLLSDFYILSSTRSINSDNALLQQLDTLLGGTLELDSANKPYISTKNGRIKASLLSSGQQKLLILSRLLLTDALQQGILFWDLPESNLHTKWIKLIASIIVELLVRGVQIFITTQNLFLLRELEIGLRGKDLKTHWFGLLDIDGETVVDFADDICDIETSLVDDELIQADRFMFQSEK